MKIFKLSFAALLVAVIASLAFTNMPVKTSLTDVYELFEVEFDVTDDTDPDFDLLDDPNNYTPNGGSISPTPCNDGVYVCGYLRTGSVSKSQALDVIREEEENGDGIQHGEIVTIPGVGTVQIWLRSAPPTP